MVSADLDYAQSGKTIQEAMVANAERYPDNLVRPDTIRWGNLRIKTFDCLRVPSRGIVRLEFLHASPSIRQGADLKVDGWIELAHGERVSVLRTWHDERYEDHVEYPYFSRDGILKTWNVYEMTYLGGQRVEDRWTENAGFWVETAAEHERVYHCSPGMASPPDFDALVYKLTIQPAVLRENCQQIGWN